MWSTERWKNITNGDFIRSIADTISWNVWQMDGLKKTVPGTDIPCKIKNWKAYKEILFKDVGEDD